MEPAGSVVEANERGGDGGIGGRNCACGLDGTGEEAIVRAGRRRATLEGKWRAKRESGGRLPRRVDVGGFFGLSLEGREEGRFVAPDDGEQGTSVT